MDQSFGNQSPVVFSGGLLPNVCAFNPGEMVAIYISDLVTPATARAHLEKLKAEFGENVTWIEGPTRPINFLDESRRIGEYVRDAKASKKLTVYVHRFRPRMLMVEAWSDWAFSIDKGLDSSKAATVTMQKYPIGHPNAANIKWNAEIILDEVITLATPFPLVPLSKPEPVGELETITISVQGCVHTGRTLVAAVIEKALKEAFPEKDVSIDSYDPPEAVEVARQRLATTCTDPTVMSIRAERFVVEDKQALARPLRRSTTSVSN